MNKAIGYIRVSTEQQADEGISLDAQKSKIKAWCESNDYELVAIYEDAGISGAVKLDKRAGLLAAMASVKNCKADALVVVKRDRLARDRMVTGMVEQILSKQGAKVLTTDGGGNGNTAEDVLLRGMQDLFSEYERLLISFRTKSALAHKKAIGEKYAPVPFGYKEIEGRLELVKKETEIIKQIMSKRKSGETLQAIASWLNNKGIIGKQGGKWHASSVSYVLKRQEAA